MNEALRELYQEMILDHYKHPRNFGTLEEETSHASGNNPLCGDRIAVHLLLEGDRIRDVRFEGIGCAISTASASMMTSAIKGKSVGEARRLFEEFQAMVTREGGEPGEEMKELEALAGVRQHPVRIKCATLPWHTMLAALNGGQEATTE